MVEVAMNLIDNPLYQEDIRQAAALSLPWDKLRNSSILVSGATGLIGSFLVDVIMHQNDALELQCKVSALGRSEEKAKTRFGYCYDSEWFWFIPYNINKPFVRGDIGDVDYVLHLASNTHPVAYATEPIGTMGS